MLQQHTRSEKFILPAPGIDHIVRSIQSIYIKNDSTYKDLTTIILISFCIHFNNSCLAIPKHECRYIYPYAVYLGYIWPLPVKRGIWSLNRQTRIMAITNQ